LLLFDKLGIISFLLSKFPELSKDRNTNLAILFYSFLKLPDQSKDATIDTARKTLEGLFSSEGKNKIRTDKAVKRVKEELFKAGIVLDE